MEHLANRQLWVSMLALTSLMAACSVDEDANPARTAKCAEDPVKGYCVVSEGGGKKRFDAAADQDAQADSATTETDGGSSDASSSDASSDTGTSDSAMPPVGDPCPSAMEGKDDVCYTGPSGTAWQPPCHVGTKKCVDGIWTKCTDEVKPKKETCNGIDDNCNGTTDENQAAHECTVATETGACAEGIALCQNGDYDNCIQIAFPTSETCDADEIDEDCDGLDDADDSDLVVECYDEVDDGCTGSAGGPYACAGACHFGTLNCVDGTMETVCTDDQGEGTEVGGANVLDPAIDEDCDGKTDEGIACINGAMRHCYSGPEGTEDVGECEGDDLECTNMEYGGTCDEITPKPETCLNPNEDNDCNGTDDDVAGLDTQCMAAGVGECANNGRYECPVAAVDPNPVCVSAEAGTEGSCNGKDDDCDSKTDENINFQTDKNNCGKCGTKCTAGNAACCSGKCVDLNTNGSNCGQCGRSCDCGCNGSGSCRAKLLVCL